jgi:hypothetical protein
LKNKVFQEGGVTTIGLYDIGTSTTLESNKSLLQLPLLFQDGHMAACSHLTCKVYIDVLVIFFGGLG